jgi:hypothetical protein
MYEVLSCVRCRKTVITDVVNFRVLHVTTTRFKVLGFSKYALYTLDLCPKIKLENYVVSDF